MEQFPYEKAEFEKVKCNFCQSNDLSVLGREGQDDLPLTTVICRRCGLIFINPRMTRVWYDRYYQHEYRARTRGHGATGQPPDPEKLFASMKQHGRELGVLMKSYLPPGGNQIVEVGSSLGGVLSGMQSEFGLPVVGIEPSGPEADYAKSRGVPTHKCLMEDIDSVVPTLPEFGAVVCTQSLNHLLDPRFFFGWAHRHLTSDGLLVLEVMNFRHQLKRAGRFRNAVKVDHVYMFTPEVLKDFVTAAGFDILHFAADEEKSENELRRLHRALPTVHMTLIAKKSPCEPFAKPLSVSNYRRVRRSLNPFLIYLTYLFSVRLPKIIYQHQVSTPDVDIKKDKHRDAP